MTSTYRPGRDWALRCSSPVRELMLTFASVLFLVSLVPTANATVWGYSNEGWGCSAIYYAMGKPKAFPTWQACKDYGAGKRAQPDTSTKKALNSAPKLQATKKAAKTPQVTKTNRNEAKSATAKNNEKNRKKQQDLVESERQRQARDLSNARELASAAIQNALSLRDRDAVPAQEKSVLTNSAVQLKASLKETKTDKLIAATKQLNEVIARVNLTIQTEATRKEEELAETHLLNARTDATLVMNDANGLTSRGLDDKLSMLIQESIASLEEALRQNSAREIELNTTRLAGQINKIRSSLNSAEPVAVSNAQNPEIDAVDDPQQRQKRVALIVGNGAYENVVPLRNPVNDAADMAAALSKLGFEITHLNNLDMDQFEEALADFSEESTGADFAIVYFAGHGIEVDKQNYLVPVDAELKTDRRLRFEAISLDEVMATLEAVKGIRMVLLDACRNNPFAQTMKLTVASRSVGRGLTRVEAANGTVISFSAKEGTVASDGSGRNSPFTAALLANIATPGLELQFLLRRVRDAVRRATNDEQEPFISASLPGEAIYLVAP